MADKVNLYSTSLSDLFAIQNTTDKLIIGKDKVSLTHMTDTTVPAVAAGSLVEVAGALYYCSTERSISGSPSDGIVYIIAVPSGDNITFQFTNTAPTWSDSKQGWYGTGGAANYRYVAKVNKSTSSYTGKMILENYYASTPQGKFEKVLLLANVSISDVGYNVDTTLSTVNSTTIDTHAGLSSGIYTIPIKGIYRIVAAPFKVQSGNQPWMWYLYIKYSGSDTGSRSVHTNNSSTDGSDIFAEVDELNLIKSFEVDDTIYLAAKNMYNGGGPYPASGYFSIELVYPL